MSSTVPSSLSHQSLAQHYYLDSLDLMFRFCTYWERQPRRSSRVKSFIDLMMACECILKSMSLIERQNLPILDAFSEVKKFRHNITKIAMDLGKRQHPKSDSIESARDVFGRFDVGLRYSIDSHTYFFPISGVRLSGAPTYDETLGNGAWVSQACSLVEDLLEWGKTTFGGELVVGIKEIIESEEEIEDVVCAQVKRGRS